MAENSVMKEKRKKDLLIQVGEVIDEAIRLGISGEEIEKIWWRSSTRRQKKREVIGRDRGKKSHKKI